MKFFRVAPGFCQVVATILTSPRQSRALPGLTGQTRGDGEFVSRSQVVLGMVRKNP